MGLEVFYPNDILNALLAARRANDLAGASLDYTEGYNAALEVIALAFGLVDNRQRKPSWSSKEYPCLPRPNLKTR